MNTGLQDAYNLAWKLALVVKSRASDALLETYEQERRMIAQNLLRSTDRAFSLIVSESWFARLFRTRIFANLVAFAMRFARAREAAFRTLSQIGVRYRASALSQTLPEVAPTAPRAGDRFPWLRLKFHPHARVQDLFERLDDRCFNLIVIGQALPQAAADSVIDALALHLVIDDPVNDQALKRAGISGPSYFLLRPDGYIALSGGWLALADFDHYFAARHIRLAPRAGDDAASPARSGLAPQGELVQ